MDEPKVSAEEITVLLHQWRGGNREAFDRLIPLVYDELKLIASRRLAREWQGDALQTGEGRRRQKAATLTRDTIVYEAEPNAVHGHRKDHGNHDPQEPRSSRPPEGREGHYSTEDEVVADALRLMQARDEVAEIKRARLKDAIHRGYEDAGTGRVIRFETDDQIDAFFADL